MLRAFRPLPRGARVLDIGFLALVLFGSATALAGLLHPAYRLNSLWVGGGGPQAWLDALALVAGAGLLARPRNLRVAARAVTSCLCLLCVRDVVVFYELLASGRVHSAFPLPASLAVVALLAWGSVRLPSLRRPSRRLACGVAVALPVFALGHVLTFGSSDYRRPADAAVVFGAAVRPDGAPSLALLDRTRTACDLYHQGLVRHLVLSGGRDRRAPLSEPACMARIAVAHGVPADALVPDERGTNTRASLDELRRIANERGWRRSLLVSHDYHLARIALGARRRGLAAYTVPARESRPWRGKPVFVARELAALFWYAATDV